MRAIDLAILRVIGAGVVSGLVVSAAGVVSAGEALIGHVLALAAPASALPLCAHSATNYVFLAMPPAPACVGADGKDAGLLKVNQTGTAPDSAVLLGVVVTDAAGGVVSVDPHPAGRRDLAVPFSAAPGGGGGSGAAGTISIRHVYTGDPGTEVQIVNVGTPGAAVLDITIPQGLTGAPGTQGIQGKAALTPRGAFDPAASYAVGDFVYDGSAANTGSFIALQPSQGAALVDGANWRLAQPPGKKGDPGPAFFKPRGPYDATVTYAAGDVVGANRAAYAAVQASTGQPVSNAAYWQLLLDAAPAGDAAAIVAVEIHTLPAGSAPTVDNIGTQAAAHFVFGIPAGGAGAAAVGPATAAAFGTVKLDVTENGGSTVYSKTTADGLFALKTALGTAASHADAEYEHVASKGAPNGYAALDAGGKVPTSQLPASVLGGVDYQGVWDAAANSPALASGVGTKGFYYKVGAAGGTALDGNANWHAGDWAVFDGTVWEKIDNYEAVTRVAGKIGDVTLVAADITDLGTAATHAVTDFDAAGAATAAQQNAITASLQKASNLSDLGNAASARTNLGMGTAAVANLPAAGANASAAQVVRGDDARLGTCIRYAKSQFSYSTLPSGTLTDPIGDILPALPSGVTWVPVRASVSSGTSANPTPGAGNTFQATVGGSNLLTAALAAGSGVQTTTAVSTTGIAGGSVVNAVTTLGGTAGANFTFSVEYQSSKAI